MRTALQTERLILRDIEEADAEKLGALDSDPEVMRYLDPWPRHDADWYRERIHNSFVPKQAHPWLGLRIVQDRANGIFVGWVFLFAATATRYARELGWTRADEVEIGYRYHRSAWGRGIATEAAQPLLQIALADPTTSAVVGCAQAGNARSLRVLDKLGLKRDGEIMLPGAHEATVKLSRLKTD